MSKFFVFLVISTLIITVNSRKKKAKHPTEPSTNPPCPAGMQWTLDDTPADDTTIFRRAALFCQDPTVKVSIAVALTQAQENMDQNI